MALFRCEPCNQPGIDEVQLTTNSMIDHLNDAHGIPVRDFTENTTLLRDTGGRDKNTGPRPRLNGGEQLVNEEWAP